MRLERHPGFLCFLAFVSLLLISNLPAAAQTLYVMSYNIHHGADRAEKPTLEEIGRFIKTSGADLIGLQEVDSLCGRSGNVDQMKELAAITGMHYAFVRHFAYDGGAYGLGILSRYPVSEVKNHRITSLSKAGKGSLALLSAVITLPGKKKVQFATVHFALDQPTRLTQSGETMEFLKGSLPVILTGDLNAEPGQEEITQLGKIFSFGGLHSGPTYPDQEPVKKIDYILVSKDHLKKFTRTKVWEGVQHSDHLPLSTEAKLR
ncbi:endonuclease/exonuclease/phosphatase family protein [Anseongella ginsenosidimutans]|nr:endonuclease/exonuclease/phosphatase family protein [Anseongella ginsenosidimutans]QEC53893.1 metal-dependent hydrolase [Anseongella ginsenosidimutans]